MCFVALDQGFAGGVLHSFWAVKADTRQPLLHATVLAMLLELRFVRRRGSSRRKVSLSRESREASR